MGMNEDPWQQEPPKVPPEDAVSVDDTLHFSRQSIKGDVPVLCHKCRQEVPSAKAVQHGWDRHAAYAVRILGSEERGWVDGREPTPSMLRRLRRMLRRDYPEGVW